MLRRAFLKLASAASVAALVSLESFRSPVAEEDIYALVDRHMQEVSLEMNRKLNEAYYSGCRFPVALWS